MKSQNLKNTPLLELPKSHDALAHQPHISIRINDTTSTLHKEKTVKKLFDFFFFLETKPQKIGYILLRNLWNKKL